MSDDKFAFENIEALSLTPGMWTIFKFKMLTAFNAKGWGEHLTRSTDPADEPASGDDTPVREAKAERRAKRELQQMKSKAALVNKLDTTAIELIMHLDHTHEIWQALNQSNASISQAGIASKREELGTLKYKEGTNIATHLATINRLNLELRAAGIILTDLELVTTLYRSMPKIPEWQGLIQSLSMIHATTPYGTDSLVTYAFVSSQFREHFRVMMSEKGSANKKKPQDIALYGEGNSKKNDTCNKCGKKGHWANECRSKAKESSGSAKQEKKKNKGKSKKDNGKKGGQGDAGSADDNQANHGHMHLALVSSKKLTPILEDTSDDITFLDSGASDHYFRNCNWFHSYSTESHRTTVQGVEKDRGITIAGCGTVDIRFQVSPNSTHDITIENVYHTPDFSANLISVGRLESKGLQVEFKNGKASVWNGKTLVMTATCVGSVYPIHMRANLPK